MIRKIRETEKEWLMDRLKQDPSRTMFIYGDIQQNGLQTDYQEIWLDEQDDKIGAVLLRYHNNFVFYLFDTIYDLVGFKERLDDPRINVMSGSKSQIDSLPSELFSSYKFRTMYFCECKELKDTVETINVVRAQSSDATSIAQSFYSITEFSDFNTNFEDRAQRMFDKLDSKKSRAFIVYDQEKVIAHANTSVETDASIMVGGVFTLPEYRTHGLASSVVYELTKECLNEGKVPCLFYDNPKAGSIYHRLGYETFDLWTVGKKVNV